MQIENVEVKNDNDEVNDQDENDQIEDDHQLQD